MNRVAIVSKLNKPEAVSVSGDVSKWLMERGIDVFVDPKLGEMIDATGTLPPSELFKSAELVVVFGGDGTILYTARLLCGKATPILGINLGGLGFLTAIGEEEIYPVLEEVIKGRFATEERMTLSVELCRDGETISTQSILNDVVIKGKLARLVRLETKINREYVNTYRADGLIIATPTGSTAYSLSTGGPILYPTIHSIVVAPICPFNLTNRPVVIPDWMDVEVIVKNAGCDPFITLDGQIDIRLLESDTVKVKRAESSVYLLKSPVKSFFDILRGRLLWDKKD